jgi:hypothetical protein
MRSQSEQIAKVLRYFSEVDNGNFPQDLFTENFQFFAPKYGVGHGREDFLEMVSVGGIQEIRHPVDEMLILEQGNHVAVEGLTEGVTADGFAWRGGETPAGRFSSFFSFDRSGKIERMHVYVDPDFAGRHVEGFKWQRACPEW